MWVRRGVGCRGDWGRHTKMMQVAQVPQHTCIKGGHASIDASLHSVLKSGFHSHKTCVTACRAGVVDMLLTACRQG